MKRWLKRTFIGAVDAEPARIGLWLRNPIGNALRRCAAGPPSVFLRREAGGRVALGVRDFGPGPEVAAGWPAAGRPRAT